MKNSAIAIVGMAGRFPGARNIAEFWRNLRDGVESIRALSDAELRQAGVSAEEIANPDYVKSGAILEDLDLFDASFFGFSPKDASIMDPQHRHLLECAWEALEHAGHPAEKFAGSIGLYAGSGMNTYLIYNLLTNRRLMESAGLFLIKQTGNDKDVLATRISYELDLRGPSVNVQTACSTSLVAVHLACQSLLNQECDMALAGGVTIEIPHGHGYIYREGEILSRDGHCRSFDASSSGTVFSSGAAMVALRRLEDALEDHDTIHAIILGSAINNDGSRKVGYLAPSVEGQAEVIAEAQAVAGVPASDISYVETHGTGTTVGDPIEVKALTEAFRETSVSKGFCAIGSLKSNVGHLDAAAGVAGLIKTVLALEHRQIPASLHFQKPNPLIDFQNSPFYVNTKLAEWETIDQPRRAGVTSLGIGGTNAHVVLEEAPAMGRSRSNKPNQLVVLSAKTASALDLATRNLARHLRENPDLHLADVAFTSQVGRKAFPHRRIVVAASTSDAANALATSDAGRIFSGAAEPAAPSVVFMFSGQGSQYLNMGRDMYATEPIFRAHIDSCADRLFSHLALDLRKLLYPPEQEVAAATEQLNRTCITQPALFSIEYSLAQWWIAHGIRPQAMVGHSIGEYVAACLAGVMSLEDALEISAIRGRMMQEMPAGSMLAVPLADEEIRLPADLSIAAVNGLRQCVVSGPTPAIEELEHSLAKQGVTCRKLHTSHAFHSAMMDPMLDSFASCMSRVKLSPPIIPYLSNVTGTWITAAEATDLAYWVRHLRNTVRFSDCIVELLRRPDRILLEIGPGQALTSLARQNPGKKVKVLASLPHPQDKTSDAVFVLNTLGQLWISGAEVDWNALHANEPLRRVPLPTYPFERQRFWIEPSETKAIAEKAPLSSSGNDDPERWFYRHVWKKTDTPTASSTAPTCWLLFMDKLGLGSQIAKHLKHAGHKVIEIVPGDSYKRLGRSSYRVRPGVRADYDTLFSDIVQHETAPTRILHLWTVRDASSKPDLDEILDSSFYSLLFLAQALGDRDMTPLEIASISNGLQSVSGEELSHPARATLFGPMKVIPKELPGIACRNIDVEARILNTEQSALRIIAELSSTVRDPVIAYRGEERWVGSFEHEALRSRQEGSRLKEKGVYLITGGLGGIGLVIAEHLARTSHARLVLVGRSELPPTSEWKRVIENDSLAPALKEKIRKLLEIESLGGEVLTIRADVTSREEMAAAVKLACERFGGIHGVIHAAGVVEDSPLLAKDRESATRVLDPKIKGTLVLDEILADHPLDFFVLFSSISSLSPPPGQVDYAAANSFLDAFALSRSSRRTIAINWGLWRDVGMAAHLKSVRPLLERRVSQTSEETIYSSQFSCAKNWLLDEHRLKTGNALVPGTGYLEMALEALAPTDGAIELRDVFFLAPLSFESAENREVRLKLRRDGNAFQFTVLAEADEWHEYATGQIERKASAPAGKRDPGDLIARCSLREIIFSETERTRQENYFDFGPRWRNLKRIHLGRQESVAVLELDAAFIADLRNYVAHPALLDLATGSALYLIRDYDSSNSVYLPVSYAKLTVHRPLAAKVYSYIRSRESISTQEVASFDISILDEQGNSLIEIEQYSVRRIENLGTISGMHMGNRSKTPASLSEVDHRSAISPVEGAQALSRILASEIRGNIIFSSLNIETPSDQNQQIPQIAKAQVAPTEAIANSSDDVESKLVSIWQDLLGTETLGLSDNFFDLGGNSLLAARLSAKVKKLWGRGFPLATLFQAPTIEKMAAVLRRDNVVLGSPRVAAIQPEGTRPPFLCVDAGPFFRRLAHRLGEDQPFFGLRLADTDDLPTHFTMADIAAYHIRTIRELQPQGPYYLGGWSAGGLVAYEIAQQLRSQGQQVSVLALFDALNTASLRKSSRFEAFRASAHFWSWKLKYHMENLRRLGLRGTPSYLLDEIRTVKLNLQRKLWLTGDKIQRRFGSQLAVAPREATKVVFVASRNYQPKPYAGNAVLFRCAAQPLGSYIDPELGWHGLLQGGLDICEMPGDHDDMFLEPHVELLAKELERRILAARHGHLDHSADSGRRVPPDGLLQEIGDTSVDLLASQERLR